MSTTASYLLKLSAKYQGSEEERQCAHILFTEVDIQMNDQRLNHLAALTYNMIPCQRIFAMIEKGIEKENPWKTIYKSLLLLHTIILYGAESAIDKCVDMCKYIHPLQQYNSALVKKGFFSSGGTDYGAPVRAEATIVTNILMKDDNIRHARMEARAGQNSLVPMGHVEKINPSEGQRFNYGQAVNTSVGAGFSLENVPGMYEGRPERYFDNTNDPRSRTTQGNAQITRDALAPSLLDLAFDDVPTHNTAANLPPADYLPALEKQKELERQLAEQQELLRRLQEQQQRQQQAPPPQPAQPSAIDSILSLSMQAPSTTMPNTNMYGGYPSMGSMMPNTAMQPPVKQNAIDLLDMGMMASVPSNLPPMHAAQPQTMPSVQSMQSAPSYPGIPFNQPVPGMNAYQQPAPYGAPQPTAGYPPYGSMPQSGIPPAAPNASMGMPPQAYNNMRGNFGMNTAVPPAYAQQPPTNANPQMNMQGGMNTMAPNMNGYGMPSFQQQQQQQPHQQAPVQSMMNATQPTASNSLDLLGFDNFNKPTPAPVAAPMAATIPNQQIPPMQAAHMNLHSSSEERVLSQFNAQYNTPYASPPPVPPNNARSIENPPLWSYDYGAQQQHLGAPPAVPPPIPQSAPHFDSFPVGPPPPVPSMPPPDLF